MSERFSAAEICCLFFPFANGEGERFNRVIEDPIQTQSKETPGCHLIRATAHTVSGITTYRDHKPSRLAEYR